MDGGNALPGAAFAGLLLAWTEILESVSLCAPTESSPQTLHLEA